MSITKADKKSLQYFEACTKISHLADSAHSRSRRSARPRPRPGLGDIHCDIHLTTLPSYSLSPSITISSRIDNPYACNFQKVGVRL